MAQGMVGLVNNWPLNFPEDQLPWGRSFTKSVIAHILILIPLFLMSRHQKPLLVLTEVTIVDTTPVQRPKSVSLPAPERAAAPEIKGPSVSGGPVGGGVKKGFGPAPKLQRGIPIPSTNNPINAAPSKGFSKMANELPVSSPVGTPQGIALTPIVPSAPIATIPSDFGAIGRKKVELAPLAGRVGKQGTDSGAGGGGASGNMRQVPGLIGTGDGKANLNVDARRMGGGQGDVELGVPLFASVGGGGGAGNRGTGYGTGEAGSLGGGGRAGSTQLLGNPKAKPGLEKLMSNPKGAESWGDKKGPFSIEGPLKYRKILQKELPIYPRWAEEKGITASVSIRIWAAPNGKVKTNMYLEKTSGYTELDRLAKEAIAKFVFIALPREQDQEDEWGIATFRFELKD